MKNNNQIKIDDLCIDLSTLKSKEDLIAHFEEDGATYSSLMDFCEEYMERYADPARTLYIRALTAYPSFLMPVFAF